MLKMRFLLIVVSFLCFSRAYTGKTNYTCIIPYTVFDNKVRVLCERNKSCLKLPFYQNKSFSVDQCLSRKEMKEITLNTSVISCLGGYEKNLKEMVIFKPKNPTSCLCINNNRFNCYLIHVKRSAECVPARQWVNVFLLEKLCDQVLKRNFQPISVGGIEKLRTTVVTAKLLALIQGAGSMSLLDRLKALDYDIESNDDRGSSDQYDTD